ncbi:MAG TPA: hypothetical protein VN371_00870 [Chlorobaculum sp.]|nr:hypothetical protein [Chlorobaculum sp.]
MTKKRFSSFATALLSLLLCSGVSFAATSVSGHGTQTRGSAGHNAEIHGQLFTLPGSGTITSIEGNGASGFWIEKGSGEMVKNFNTLAEAKGYSLPAGNYRVIPNIKDGANSCGVTVTVTCP